MSSLAHDNDASDQGRADGQECDRLRPLEERLRRLSWPEPPPGARERTLAELHRKLAELDGSGNGAAGDPPVPEPEVSARERRVG